MTGALNRAAILVLPVETGTRRTTSLSSLVALASVGLAILVGTAGCAMDKPTVSDFVGEWVASGDHGMSTMEIADSGSLSMVNVPAEVFEQSSSEHFEGNVDVTGRCDMAVRDAGTYYIRCDVDESATLGHFSTRIFIEGQGENAQMALQVHAWAEDSSLLFDRASDVSR